MKEFDSSALFIINTLSGNQRNRTTLLQTIKKNYSTANIFVIQSKNDFEECIKLGHQDKFRYLIINGGDGTINSFLPILIKQNKILGILPAGSGNGLARTLGIPLNSVRALDLLQKQNVQQIDVGKLIIKNGDHSITNYFSCAVGVGVDAYIAYRFEQQKIRGLIGYVWAALKEFFVHKVVQAHLNIDDKLSRQDGFLILSMMNIPQYGNEFYLSPSAKSNDGFLNLVILNKISIFQYPIVLFNLLRKKEKYPMHFLQFKNLQLKILSDGEIVFHIDGEPKILKSHSLSFEISVVPSALRVFVQIKS